MSGAFFLGVPRPRSILGEHYQHRERKRTMDLDGIRAYLGRIFREQRQGDEIVRLNEPEVFGLLQLAGLETAPAAFLPPAAEQSARTAWADQAQQLASASGGRLLLKVTGRRILHKTELGGVKILDAEVTENRKTLLAAADSLAEAVAGQGADADVEGILAEGFVPHTANRPGQEVLLSLRRDPAFGPVVVIGLGGTLTEWYGKGCRGESTLIFPAAGLTEDEVSRALGAHPLLRILCGPSRLYDQAPVEVGTLASAVCALAAVGRSLEEDQNAEWRLAEIEINPAVASSGRLVALDGVGALTTATAAAAGRPLARIANLLQPRSAVVLGVSARGDNPGRIILDNLCRSQGIPKDRLAVVHAREQEIAGVPCCRDVASLPGKFDLAVVAIPAEGALEAISDLVTHNKAESIILIPGGFAEAGRQDLAGEIERTLDESHRCGDGGPVLVGGNCLGIVSRDNYNTFFLPSYKLPFHPGLGENLAVISQSGAYLVTFASNYDGLISPRASISYGNQMDLTVSDFLAHFLEVPEVQVMACYVEGFRPDDGARFLELACRARDAGKRVIVFKAGRTALGAQAAASHTASLAGDYAVARACLESAGVTVADSLNHFEDLIMTFTLLAGKAVTGRRTGIISNAGFECSTVMDQLDGLELSRFDEGTQNLLDEILPGFAHRTNPIDCTPMTATDAFAAACGAILDCATVDAAILASVPVTPSLNNLPRATAGQHGEDLEDPASQPRQMIDRIDGSAKPAVVVVDSGSIYDPMCRMLLAAGIPVFRKIDRAARALSAFCAVAVR
ncbi:hypothetical protein CO151_05720 [bacterium CG_4_9_14_3_um_filter_65_15]|nr:MAG: hypothetical protein CO151_05720 [bacterium CG_4_9_14_3_um_filter_65_15]